MYRFLGLNVVKGRIGPNNGPADGQCSIADLKVGVYLPVLLWESDSTADDVPCDAITTVFVEVVRKTELLPDSNDLSLELRRCRCRVSKRKRPFHEEAELL